MIRNRRHIIYRSDLKYFSAIALQGLLSNPDAGKAILKHFDGNQDEAFKGIVTVSIRYGKELLLQIESIELPETQTIDNGPGQKEI